MGTNRARDQAINGVNITSATDVRSVSLTANLEISHSSSIPCLAKSPATITEQYFSDQHKTNSIPPSLHWQSLFGNERSKASNSVTNLPTTCRYYSLKRFQLLDITSWTSTPWGGTNDSNSFRLQ